MLHMGRHRPLSLSNWLVSLFSASQLFFMTNLPDNMISNNNSAGLNDTEAESNTVSYLPPSSLPTGPNKGAAQPPLPPPPPDESSGAASERLPQTRRVDNSSDNDDDEERPKPSDSLAVAGSCIVLLNSVPARDTIDHRILIIYDVYMVLLILALFISIGLYIYSLRPDSDHGNDNDNDRRVDVKARKRVVMTVAVALVVASIALRSTIGLPIANIEIVLPLLIIEAAVVLVSLYFYLIRNRKKQPGTTEVLILPTTAILGRPSLPGHPLGQKKLHAKMLPKPGASIQLAHGQDLV